MKLTILLPAVLTLAVAAQGQSNSPTAMTPAEPGLVSAKGAATTAASANLAIDGNQRVISLDECVELALRHNLDLQIERYNPSLSLYSLRTAYGGYDPVFKISGQNDYSESGSTFNPSAGFTAPGSISKDHKISSDLSGSLPWGMTYDLFGTATEGYGVTSGTNQFDNTRGQVGITATQPLLRNFWVDNTRLTIAVAKNRVKFSEQGLRQQLINTVGNVENAYYELIYAQESVKVQEKSLQLAEQLFKENKKRVEVGVLAPLDEKQAESQMAARRADLLAAQRTLETRQNALKTLITDDYAAWHDLVLLPNEPLSAQKQMFNLRDSWSRGLNDRPDMMQTKLDLEQSGIQLKYYRNQVFPQLDLFGTYGYGASGSRTVEFSQAFDNFRNGDLPFYSYGIQFSIPLGNVAARNRYKSSKLTVEQALLTLKKFEQSVMVQIDEAIKQAQSSFERVKATREASEFAQAALEAEQKKLENGKSTSFEVLRLQSDLTAARSAEIRALADYNEALTSLAQTEGSTLERRKIDVKVK